MKEENQYRNGFRGVRYYADGSHDMETFASRRSQVKETQTARTERLVLHFSKDGAETSLYHTCRKSVCVGHKVRMEGWCFDVGKNGFRRYVKRHWSKLNRIHSKWVAHNEYVDQSLVDDEPEHGYSEDDYDYEWESDYGYADYADDHDDADYVYRQRDENKRYYDAGYNDGYNAALQAMTANRNQARSA
jgi:hypothetical protein